MVFVKEIRENGTMVGTNQKIKAQIFENQTIALFGGGRGIRTPGGVTLNSFQDCRNRPLCHSSFRVFFNNSP